jgi:phage gpG-like protein
MDIEIKGLNNLMDLVSDLSQDLENLDLYLEQDFDDDMRGIISENYEQIWRTEGAAIGEDWDGHTLVKTGRLRNSLTNPGSLQVRVQGDLIIFGTNVPYAPYVNAMYTFEGLTPEAVGKMDDLVGDFLKQRTILNWS